MTRLLLAIVMLLLTACDMVTLNSAEQSYRNEDYQTAAIKLQRLANMGNPEGQYALGYLYYYGKGVPQSDTMAKYWIGKAAQQGKPEAVEALNLMRTDHSVAASPSLQNILNRDEPTEAVYQQKSVNIPAPKLDAYMGKNSRIIKRPASVAKQSKAAYECVPIVSDNTYRIELFNTDSPLAAKEFTQLQTKGLITQCYSARQNNKSLYRVTYGRYWTRQDAEQGLQQLPGHLKLLNPSVRLFN